LSRASNQIDSQEVRRSLDAIFNFKILTQNQKEKFMVLAFVATHDRTHADYQQQWDSLVPKGYRPISISVYGQRSNPLYAAVWVQRPGSAFAGIHGADASAFQKFFDTWAAKGYSPTILSVTGPSNNPVFASVMEQSNHGVSLTRYGLVSGSDKDSSTIEYWMLEARQKNWIPRWISIYGEPNNRRYAIVLDPNPLRSLWSVDGWWGENSTDYQNRFNAQVQQWARPAFVTVSPDVHYLSVFREDSIGDWVARHGMSSQQYQQQFNEWTAKGMFPVYVQAGGEGENARFAALFATRDTPLDRKFTMTGPAVPAMSAIDTKVKKFMQENGTRATGVAVTYKGRLVFARGYTWGEPDYPVTQPTSMFRIASCSKPITSIAIHQLIQQNQLSLNDSVQSILNLTPAPGGTMDGRFKDITVLNLLTHTSGWDRSEVSDLSNVEVVAQAHGLKSLPTSKQQLANYMAGRPLQFAPGAEQEYSNLGFLLLGLIIERKLGMSYVDAIVQRILKPLGLFRPHRAPVAQSDQKPGAVRQHEGELRIAPSAVSGNPKGNRPLVPLPYGGEDYALFDSFGGWCMAPVDYAKILAAFALGDRNPLLKKSSVDMMWTVPSLYQKATDVEMPHYTNGWDSWTEPNGVRGFQHGGGMPGVVTRILYRTDGWGFAVFCNGAGTPDIYPELSQLSTASWPTHDLFPQFGIPKTWIAGWALEHFQEKNNELVGQGYYLNDLQGVDIGGGNWRYNAVWNHDPAAKRTSNWVTGWALKDFDWKNNELSGQGYYLTDLQGVDIGGGNWRYNAVWNHDSAAKRTSNWVTGWALKDFDWKNNELSGQGYYLTDLQGVDIGGGNWRYNAVWNRDPVGQRSTVWVAGWALEYFDGKNNELSGEGYYLTVLQAVDIGGGEWRYNAVWNRDPATKRSSTWVAGWAIEHFDGKNNELHGQGYHLTDLQGVDIGGGNWRYNAVWNR
jgi:CubicO group peptidase (beta-lactamase class C family)